MPQQMLTTVENNFSGGLKTEFTGLNFPENACTETYNCVFSTNGEVTRRPGFNLELGNTFNLSNNTLNKAISSFVWTSPGGSGNVKILVQQIGARLLFYEFSQGVNPGPVSALKLPTDIELIDYSHAVIGTSDNECQYAEGNGYLFVFHPACDTIYLSYNLGVITATRIDLKIRDVTGIIEGFPDNYRPVNASAAHQYNLYNQGWTSAPAWSATSTNAITTGTGVKSWTVQTGLAITGGTSVRVVAYDALSVGGSNLPMAFMQGTVNSYNSGTGVLTLNITSATPGSGYTIGMSSDTWTFEPINAGLMEDWLASQGNYPSNADVWWRFKDTTGVFNPTVTAPNVTLGSGPAPRGFYVTSAFNPDWGTVSGIPGLPTAVSTGIRPSTGAWYQGRVWYSGVHDSKPTLGAGAPAYSWAENVYFSQIIENTSQFGRAYQNNDPTSQDFFDLLPSDGGVITIQGCGNIHKLFPIQNGLLVFAVNGIWVITGSQGIGFSATDYTVTKISSVSTISGSSFVNVMGWPMFWNEDGIYYVAPAQKADDRQTGGFSVQNITMPIASFYDDIPNVSKKYAKGDYDPINTTVKWVYRSALEEDLTQRYEYDRVLNFDLSIKAFYPYSFTLGQVKLKDIKYISPPPTLNSAPPVFKYLCSANNTHVGFAQEFDDEFWVDFRSFDGVGANYDSYFVTGYKLHGKALTKFQPLYIYVFSNNEIDTQYKIQGIWDYAGNRNSGRYSSIQLIVNDRDHFNKLYRRHKIRGQGLALQFKVMSVAGEPFDIFGWSTMETVNAGI